MSDVAFDQDLGFGDPAALNSVRSNFAALVRAAAALTASYVATGYALVVGRKSVGVEVKYAGVDHDSIEVALEQCAGDPAVAANWTGVRSAGVVSGAVIPAGQHVESHVLAKFLSATTYGFVIPVSLSAGANRVRARVKATGGTIPGGTVSVRILPGVGL